MENKIVRNTVITILLITLQFMSIRSLVSAQNTDDYKLEYREKTQTTREVKTVVNFNNTGSCSQNVPYITCTETGGGSYGTRYETTTVTEWTDWSDWITCPSNNCPSQSSTRQVETRKLFAVIVDTDGGTIDGNVNKFYGLVNTKIIIPDSSKEGYIFKGYTSNNNNLVNNEVTFKNSTTTLKAQFEAKEFTVIFVDKDGNELKREVVKYNENATPPQAPEIYGYVFIDWNNNYTNIKDNITLQAVYKEKEWNVTFLDDKGSVIEVIKTKHNQSVTPPKAPEVYGYIFTGWDKDLSSISEDTTVKAIYNIDNGVPRFNVTYKVDGSNRDYGSLVENNSSKDSIVITNVLNKTVLNDILPQITFCNKCKFTGYFIDDKLVDPEKYTITKNEIISLRFYSDVNNNNIDDSSEYITITFDSMGGSKIDSLRITLNSRISELKAPSRDGYNFAGWYTSASYSNKWNLSDRAIQDTVLYAKWDVKPQEPVEIPNITVDTSPVKSIEVEDSSQKTTSINYSGLNSSQIIANSAEETAKAVEVIEEIRFTNRLKGKYLTIKFIENYDDVKLEKNFKYADTLRIFYDEENYQEYSVRQSGVIKLPEIEKETDTKQFVKWGYKYNDVWRTYEIRPIFKEKVIETIQVKEKVEENNLFSVKTITIVSGIALVSSIVIAVILNKSLKKGENDA